MANERNHTYSKDGVSFRFYNDPKLANPIALQKTLVGKKAANHGLRFTKFFGSWATDTERPAGQEPGLVLLRDIWEWKEQERRRQGEPDWEPRQDWVKTDPVLDWLDPLNSDDRAQQQCARQAATLPSLLVGDPNHLAEANRRTAALALARAKAMLGQAVSQDAVTVEMTLVSRLLTGIGLPHPTENGFLFHPTLAVPYLRGTALKQVARDRAVADGENRERIANLFGGVEGNTPTNAGCIAFLDALPTKEVTLTAEQITAHYGDYYGQDDPFADDRIEPGDWHEPNPVTLLALEQGPVFPVSITPLAIGGKPPTRDDLKDVLGWLSEGLEFDGIGARTTLGFGRLQSVDSKKAEDARRPLATGDAAIVDNEYHDTKFRGQVGVIEEIYKNQPMAKVRFVINGKGKQKPIPLAHLGRAPETP